MVDRGTGEGGAGRIFVFMGVSGAGKSTVAKAVADALGGSFVEADELHPAENVETMRAGLPLTDEDRWPWLARVCEEALARAPPVMVSCSALKQSYRSFIASRLPGVVFVHLTGPDDLIRNRMASRSGHFMPVSLLDSQLAILEPPEEGPGCHRISIGGDRTDTIAQAVSICRRHLTGQDPSASGR
ncbi:gluconokinase [Hoeflea sp.]|uniref:gluconokinase n=1 Tax=Hoeflea sp. TaxID=1940281 RepID=UPI0025BCA4C0|nr:gluconokinase [Hoeflea sp.]